MGKYEAVSELKAQEAWGSGWRARRGPAQHRAETSKAVHSAQWSLQSQDSGPN